MKIILKPNQNSKVTRNDCRDVYEMVDLCDGDGDGNEAVYGSVSVDLFSTTPHANPLWDALFYGKSVTVEITEVTT